MKEPLQQSVDSRSPPPTLQEHQISSHRAYAHQLLFLCLYSLEEKLVELMQSREDNPTLSIVSYASGL